MSLLPSALLASCSTILLSTQGPLSRSSIAIAAPVPTPTAGTTTLLTPPVPNPVPFVGAQGQTLLSGQYNSNFYALWNYATLIAQALNGCGYVPGAAFSNISYTYPVSASASACAPGVGSTLSLSLAHGDYDDLASAQTISGAKTFTAAIAASAANISGNIGVSGSIFGVNETLTGGLTTGAISSTGTITTTGSLFAANETLTGGLTTGAISSTGAIATSGSIFGSSETLTGGLTTAFVGHGTTGSYPYDATVYAGGEHFERWIGTATTAGVAHTFVVPFSSSTSYQCSFTPYAGFVVVAIGALAATSVGVYSQTGTQPFHALCWGS